MKKKTNSFRRYVLTYDGEDLYDNSVFESKDAIDITKDDLELAAGDLTLCELTPVLKLKLVNNRVVKEKL